jgi:hypothetical protein
MRSCTHFRDAGGLRLPFQAICGKHRPHSQGSLAIQADRRRSPKTGLRNSKRQHECSGDNDPNRLPRKPPAPSSFPGQAGGTHSVTGEGAEVSLEPQLLACLRSPWGRMTTTRGPPHSRSWPLTSSLVPRHQETTPRAPPTALHQPALRRPWPLPRELFKVQPAQSASLDRSGQ